MPRFSSPLDAVDVAAPCPADWGRMRGDERVRFCDSCAMNVYNLSGMTRREAETLIAKTEGRLCVRFYRRSDGTILTDNCPVGLRALRDRARRVKRTTVAAASAVLSFYAGIFANSYVAPRLENLFPDATTTRGMTMGAVAIKPTPQPQERWTKGEMILTTRTYTAPPREMQGQVRIKTEASRRSD